jgi:type IV pilus assembly protein PilW
MKHNLNKGQQQGFTLIEIMIALLLGVFLISGAIQVFISTKQSNRMQENLSRLQENGRFAMDYLEHDIRMTGYWGCQLPTSPDVDLAGTDGAAGAADSITIRAAVTPPTGACGTAMVSAPVVCPQLVDPANVYADSRSTIAYSVVSSALRRATNCTATANADIVEGIDNMQILYGEDTDADGIANYYVASGSVVNMANVVSVRVSVLASTPDDNLTNEPIPYTYNGTTTTPTDRKIRRVFTSTIVLRNRLP